MSTALADTLALDLAAAIERLCSALRGRPVAMSARQRDAVLTLAGQAELPELALVADLALHVRGDVWRPLLADAEHPELVAAGLLTAARHVLRPRH